LILNLLSLRAFHDVVPVILVKTEWIPIEIMINMINGYIKVVNTL